MKVEFEKHMLIASELLSYCHLRGAADYDLDIKESESATVISIRSFPVSVSDEEMVKLRKRLGAPRQREIEQDYWGLSGESENTSELMLVGMMTDEAAVEYSENTLSITLKRLL